jgi:uncharacterized membrane protein YbhN (UPF0104 family)
MGSNTLRGKTGKLFLNTAGWAVSVFFLWLTLRGTNFSLIVKNFSHISVLFVIFGIFFNFLFYLVRALYQNNNLFYVKGGFINFPVSAASIGIAQFYNTIFPARMGEALRAFFLSKKENMPVLPVLSYIFIEKVVDFLFIAGLLTVAALFSARSAEVGRIILLALAMGAVVCAGIYVFIKHNKAVMGLVLPLTPGRLAALTIKFNSQIISGVKFLKTAHQAVRGFALLAAGWGCMTGVFFFFSYSYVKFFGLPLWSCVIFMIFSALSLAIPSAPSGVGVMHFCFILAVKLLSGNSPDISADAMAAFAVVLHFLVVIGDIVTSLSIIALYKLGTRSRPGLKDADGA